MSDDGEDDVRMQHGEEEDVRAKRWLERGRGKGKGKERETGEGIVEGLPLEILAHVSATDRVPWISSSGLTLTKDHEAPA